MGTPEFAVASLKRLAEDGHEICGVFTQPDRPKNRGHKLAFSPVKEYALSQGLTVYQPTKMRDGTALALVRELHPELIVVAAYGRILPEDILNTPPYGSINVHSSLLPKYRGAAPINWAILNGERETGVTIMYMAKELDAGDILHVLKTDIDPQEDAQALTARLAELGAQALSETVEQLRAGTAHRTVQDHSAYTYAPMLTKDMGMIDWTKPAQRIHDQVRGLIPWPCASTELGGATVKIFRTEVGSETAKASGTVVSAPAGGGMTPREKCGARDVALDALMQVDKANAWSDEALRRLIAQNRLDSRDAAFATRLCYGVMQNRMLLDYYIGCWCAQKPEHPTHRRLPDPVYG